MDELLDASRLTVFFLDEGQSVRPQEVGTAALVEEAAKRYDAVLLRSSLREQFRCGGSDGYIRCIRGALGVSEAKPELWTPDGVMHVEVVNSSEEELERIIRSEAGAGASARMVAGHRWPWTKLLGKEKRLEPDIWIGDWHRPWNAYSDSFCENKTVPPSNIWSVHENGLGQIGCVYTSQCLEWDWCGVIMGDGMVRRGDRWMFRRGKERADKEADVKRVAVPGSFDPEVKPKSADDDEFARLVRHAYHVLMTRASPATVLCSTDEETRAHLKGLVGNVHIHGLRPTWENLPEQARQPQLPRPGRGGRRRRNRQKKGTPPDEMRLF
ncbi:DNA/RNA helicase domain-containing protein [Streptomyces dioscori]|uniref:DNA/RNA helicase domain-containing protein n=1 Tax=Streptomyces dioscori TaxID=2109333 RepID=UPI0026A1F07F